MNPRMKATLLPSYYFFKRTALRVVTWAKICRRRSRNLPIKIELGAGHKRGSNGWLTIDISPNCDFCWDLQKGIPFPPESVEAIYSSHFLEHLSYSNIQALLDECMRVLAPGGIFSICVPNARLFIEAYSQNTLLDDSFLAFRKHCIAAVELI